MRFQEGQLKPLGDGYGVPMFAQFSAMGHALYRPALVYECRLLGIPTIGVIFAEIDWVDIDAGTAEHKLKLTTHYFGASAIFSIAPMTVQAVIDNHQKEAEAFGMVDDDGYPTFKEGDLPRCMVELMGMNKRLGSAGEGR